MEKLLKVNPSLSTLGAGDPFSLMRVVKRFTEVFCVYSSEKISLEYKCC